MVDLELPQEGSLDWDVKLNQALTALNSGKPDSSVVTTEIATAVTSHRADADTHGDRAYTDSQLSGHAQAADPHGDRAYTDDALTAISGMVHVTDGPPSSSLGKAGDWALEIGTRRLYGPKGADWTAFSQIPPPTDAGWSFNGFAALAGDRLYLTHVADGFGAGSSWYGTPQPTEGLDVTFTVEMSGGTGADGVCFALGDPADTDSTFVGAGGGDLGLVGCSALALALDTGAGSRARIVTTTPTEMTTVATYGGVLTLRPDPIQVRVRYAEGKISAWIDGAVVFDQVSVAATATARVGWTGSNGGLVDDHIIEAAQFVPRGGIQL